MKVFITVVKDDKKVNFVDEYNTFIGFDTTQQCCENAGWYISEELRDDVEDGITILEGLDPYKIDKEYFEEVSSPQECDATIVRFKLTAPELPDLYLHLFNVQNGFYSHGLSVIHNGTTIKDIVL